VRAARIVLDHQITELEQNVNLPVDVICPLYGAKTFLKLSDPFIAASDSHKSASRMSPTERA
jgi:hypothetical protein